MDAAQILQQLSQPVREKLENERPVLLALWQSLVAPQGDHLQVDELDSLLAALLTGPSPLSPQQARALIGKLDLLPIREIFGLLCRLVTGQGRVTPFQAAAMIDRLLPQQDGIPAAWLLKMVRSYCEGAQSVSPAELHDLLMLRLGTLPPTQVFDLLVTDLRTGPGELKPGDARDLLVRLLTNPNGLSPAAVVDLVSRLRTGPGELKPGDARDLLVRLLTNPNGLPPADVADLIHRFTSGIGALRAADASAMIYTLLTLPDALSPRGAHDLLGRLHPALGKNSAKVRHFIRELCPSVTPTQLRDLLLTNPQPVSARYLYSLVEYAVPMPPAVPVPGRTPPGPLLSACLGPDAAAFNLGKGLLHAMGAEHVPGSPHIEAPLGYLLLRIYRLRDTLRPRVTHLVTALTPLNAPAPAPVPPHPLDNHDPTNLGAATLRTNLRTHLEGLWEDQHFLLFPTAVPWHFSGEGRAWLVHPHPPLTHVAVVPGAPFGVKIPPDADPQVRHDAVKAGATTHHYYFAVPRSRMNYFCESHTYKWCRFDHRVAKGIQRNHFWPAGLWPNPNLMGQGIAAKLLDPAQIPTAELIVVAEMARNAVTSSAHGVIAAHDVGLRYLKRRPTSPQEVSHLFLVNHFHPTGANYLFFDALRRIHDLLA